MDACIKRNRDLLNKYLDTNNKYSWKVTAKAIAFVNKDKTRSNVI